MTIEEEDDVMSSSHKASESKECASSFKHEQLFNIVLKFTTLSEANSEAPSFFVNSNGARIGRDSSNEINIPSDGRLTDVAHSLIQYFDGKFYLLDCGNDFAASIRIGVGGHKKKWILEEGSQFSAGNSVFRNSGMTQKGEMILEIVEGPLKGEERLISRQSESTIGRSSENAICVPDKELSRHHSKFEFDKDLNKFVLSDCQSTNGTYMQLVGPYGGKLKLNLNDHILVGKTGFSINRYDFGVSEEIGHRQTMEDSCTIVQHLNITSLCVKDLSPHSFFAVYDGHGGAEASFYLSQNLHVNVAHGLLSVANDLLQLIENTSVSCDFSINDSKDHRIVVVIDDHKGQLNEREEKDEEKNEDEIGIIHNGLSSSSNVDKKDYSESEDKYETNSKTFSITEKLDEIVIKSLKESFQKTDDDFIKTSAHPQHGSTATTALILGNRLYCANVGDSRTLLCRNFVPISMSEDHKPSREDEAQRIRDAGGFIINNRVMGELAVSRSFGDSEFKKGLHTPLSNKSQNCARNSMNIDNEDKISEEKQFPQEDVEQHYDVYSTDNSDASFNEDNNDDPYNRYEDDIPWEYPLVIAEPDIQVTTITENDQFVLVGCDGLFDVFNGEDIISFVIENMREHGDCQKCCQNLTHEAIKKRHSRDNVSVILIILNKWY